MQRPTYYLLHPFPSHSMPLLLLFLLPPLSVVVAWDAHVLLAFKNSLSHSPALSSWLPTTVPCRAATPLWSSVKCDANGNVWALQLERMNLSGALNIDSLLALPALRSLSFTNNHLQGRLPDFSRFHALKSVFLASNKFSGPLPHGIFSGMPRLKKVYLQNNRISGPIPTSLVGLNKLLELRLDGNEFEGVIPELKHRDFRVFNFSFNHLQGPIPQSLANVDPAMFQGNKNLCGPPLAVSCPTSSSPKLPSKHSGALLAGIILCAIAALLAFLGLLFILACRRKKEEELPMSQSKREDYEKVEVIEIERDEGRKKTVKNGKAKLLFIREDTPRFDIEDLLRASAEVLGSGNFGSSYKAIRNEGSSVVVVKRFMDMNGVGRVDFQEHMRRLGRLSHPNLLPLVAYYYRKEEKLLVTNYVPNGSLAHMLHGTHGTNSPPLDWNTRLKIIKGVARGLAYLYEEFPMLTVPHGHLKSSNVLLNFAFEPILSDYGLVPVMNYKQASEIMVAYKSPECEQNGKPTKKTDVWSLGVLIFEILSGKFPANYLQKGKAEIDLVNWVNLLVKENAVDQVFDSNMKGTENAETDMTTLLHIGIACCEADVNKRWDIYQVLEKIEELKER